MRVARYTYLAGKLYKRGFSNPLLKCVTADQGLYVMREIHERVCGNHARKRSLLHKIVRLGYYWPSMAKDAEQYVRRCDACQHFSPLIHQPAEELNSVLSLALREMGDRLDRSLSVGKIPNEVCYGCY